MLPFCLPTCPYLSIPQCFLSVYVSIHIYLSTFFFTSSLTSILSIPIVFAFCLSVYSYLSIFTLYISLFTLIYLFFFLSLNVILNFLSRSVTGRQLLNGVFRLTKPRTLFFLCTSILGAPNRPTEHQNHLFLLGDDALSSHTLFFISLEAPFMPCSQNSPVPTQNTFCPQFPFVMKCCRLTF